MGERIHEIRLPDGTPVLARLTVLPEEPEDAYGQDEDDGDRYDDVGVLDAIAGRVLGLRTLITGIGTSVHDAAKAVKPDEISAEFGIELAVKPNKAIAAVLADGEAKASLTVTLTWHLGGEDGDDGDAQGTDA